VQQGPSGNVALYTCDGVLGSAAGTIVPPPAYAQPGYAQPGYGNTLPQSAQCADAFHQDRPGGTDYYGPPVTECPTRR